MYEAKAAGRDASRRFTKKQGGRAPGA